MALLGVNSHTAVVANVLVAARGHVEKGCLPAIRIADQGDTDGSGFLGVKIFLRGDVNQGSFSPAEGYFISKYLVFNRILEGSIHHGRDFLTGYEAHLDQSLTKIPMAADF